MHNYSKLAKHSTASITLQSEVLLSVSSASPTTLIINILCKRGREAREQIKKGITSRDLRENLKKMTSVVKQEDSLDDLESKSLVLICFFSRPASLFKALSCDAVMSVHSSYHGRHFVLRRLQEPGIHRSNLEEVEKMRRKAKCAQRRRSLDLSWEMNGEKTAMLNKWQERQSSKSKNWNLEAVIVCVSYTTQLQRQSHTSRRRRKKTRNRRKGVNERQ